MALGLAGGALASGASFQLDKAPTWSMTKPRCRTVP